MRLIYTLIASVLITAPGIAQAKKMPCLSSSEFSSLIGCALPSAIRGTTLRCSAILPEGAFLRTEGQELAERYAALNSETWPDAKAAFIKLSSDKEDVAKVLREIPDESLQEMFAILLEGMISSQIALDKCETVDRFMRLLSPLPPENTTELVTLIVSLSSGPDKPKFGEIQICES